jgi:hypothetical protein
MNIAYLYFVYKNPLLLEKTIQRLRSETAAFFIHVDQKFEIAPFEHLRAPDVFLIEPRMRVHWAEFTGCEAILLLIRQALAALKHYDYFVLLSGTEYPLRSGAYIENFLATNAGTEFITMARMPAPGKPLSRINTLRFPSTRPTLRFMFRVLAKLGLGRRDYRRYLGALEPYSGITWWALTRQACQHLVKFTEDNPAVSDFFANVFAPEETFFHTILGNSPFRSRVRRGLLYEDWSNPSGKWSDPNVRPPAILGSDHLKLFEKQKEVSVVDLHGPGELLFGRKFNDKSIELVRRVDRMICQKDGVTTVFAD